MLTRWAPDPGQECTSCSLRILKPERRTRSHSWGWGHVLIQMEQPNGLHGCLLPVFMAHRETETSPQRGHMVPPTYLVDSLQLVQLLLTIHVPLGSLPDARCQGVLGMRPVMTASSLPPYPLSDGRCAGWLVGLSAAPSLLAIQEHQGQGSKT